MKRNQKGFTVVEMVVAMVIIAILAAVIISACTSIIRKAHINNDISMAKNLNTALSIYAAQHDISTYSTPFDFAFEAIQDAGYSIENLSTKTADIYFVYEATTNQFMLIETEVSGGTIVDFDVIYCINEEYSELPVYMEGQKIDSTWYFALESEQQKKLKEKLEGSTNELCNANYLSVVSSISSLMDEANKGGKQIVYISSNLNIDDNDNRIALESLPLNSDITIVLGDSTVTNTNQISNDRLSFLSGTNLTIKGGTIIDKNTGLNSFTVNVNSEKNIALLGTTIKSDNIPLYVGRAYNSNKRSTEMLLEDCTIEGDAYGVYTLHSNSVIRNTTIEAECPISITNGAVCTIESGVIKTTNNTIAELGNGGGSPAYPTTTLIIKGGEFNFTEDQNNDNIFMFDIWSGTTAVRKNVKVVISGGTFNGEDYDAYFKKYIDITEWKNSLKSITDKNGGHEVFIKRENIDGKWVYTITKN